MNNLASKDIWPKRHSHKGRPIKYNFLNVRNDL